MKERGKGAEEFCAIAIATMSDRDRERERERDRSWKHTHPPRDKQDDDAVHAISRGPQGGREGSWDQYTTDTIGGGLGFSFLFFSLFFWSVACPPPPPSLPVSFFLSVLDRFLPFFLRQRKKFVLPLCLHFRWHQEHTCSNTICN